MSSFKRRSPMLAELDNVQAFNSGEKPTSSYPKTVIIMELGRLFQALRTAAHRGYNSEI